MISFFDIVSTIYSLLLMNTTQERVQCTAGHKLEFFNIAKISSLFYSRAHCRSHPLFRRLWILEYASIEDDSDVQIVQWTAVEAGPLWFRHASLEVGSCDGRRIEARKRRQTRGCRLDPSFAGQQFAKVLSPGRHLIHGQFFSTPGLLTRRWLMLTELDVNKFP